MQKFVFERKFEDRNYLYNEYITKDRSSKEIAKDLHVSYKLIELWLAKFDIPIKNAYV
jgi:transposase